MFSTSSGDSSLGGGGGAVEGPIVGWGTRIGLLGWGWFMAGWFGGILPGKPGSVVSAVSSVVGAGFVSVVTCCDCRLIDLVTLPEFCCAIVSSCSLM